MCGRYVLEIDTQGMLHSYAIGSDPGFDWSAVYSIAPRTKAPVVREHVDDEGEVQRTLELARWGFKPAWAKEKGPRPINARFETAHTNGMFRASFASSRAVVPMSGYYEWIEGAGGKQPYYVHPENTAPGEVLHAAGLTTAEQNDEGGWDVSFTIITREAKDAAGEVHDRMPAFLDEETMGEWLAPGKLEKDEREHLHGLLGAVSEKIAGSLITHPVDRAVNNVRTLDRKDSGLIAPVDLG
ncbi:SOS response-associated peptidase [Brachybacterium muris]|uniref:SOS response-associated peptidase n=1 Tax=Brachybacterium muris TaxID=219301 RepID=UPI00223C25FF|nr:SOS response-associated peptidase [Brachybacterium muris]MCT2296813.1 SOS response-associated peptidase [Brachybacterium muris]